jgi:hypothetical protein
MANVEDVVIPLPDANCEYIFNDVNDDKDRSVVTLSNLIKPNFTVQFKYGENLDFVVTVQKGTKSVLINGMPMPPVFETTENNCRVGGNNDYVIITTPNVFFKWVKLINVAYVTTTTAGSGVAWEYYVIPANPDQILEQFSKHRVNPDCKP